MTSDTTNSLFLMIIGLLSTGATVRYDRNRKLHYWITMLAMYPEFAPPLDACPCHVQQRPPSLALKDFGQFR